MNPTEIDAALAAANPLTIESARRMPLRDAELELVQRITAISVGAGPGRGIAISPRRRRLGSVLAAAIAGAVALLTLLPSGDRGGGPAQAFAAPLLRFAHASPLVLLKLPGWHIVYADEESRGAGELHFVRGPADAKGNPKGVPPNREALLAGRVASLTWQPGAYVATGSHSAATGLGVTARSFIREGGSRGWLDISASFIYRGRLLDFRATVTDMAMFRAELRALTAVDPTTWLKAMPPTVVKTADSGETVRQMLKGIPLPPGFDAARIRGARLVHDRYQLGAAVTGTVACMWIADWNHARAHGNTPMVRRAIAAMATAPRWPILSEMAREGGWSEVLTSYARAMPRGTVTAGRSGMPLVGAVNSGLGCSQLGVELGR
jgi:hypothetical protein